MAFLKDIYRAIKARGRKLLVKPTPTRSADRFSNEWISDSAPIIVGGCPRSGTTLTRVMLDSHANICCGPEAWLFVQGQKIDVEALAQKFDIPASSVHHMAESALSRAHFIDLFFQAYCHSAGKKRWAEKTPANLLNLDYIFQTFPHARFIHIIRDGRDVVCSLRTHPRHKVIDGELVPVKTWKPMDEVANVWASNIKTSRKYLGDPRYCEIRYESLVLDTEKTLTQMLEFVGEPWDPNMLNYHQVRTDSRDFTKFPQNPEATKPLQTAAIGRWQQDISPKDQAVFKAIAGDLLCELGYADSNDW